MDGEIADEMVRRAAHMATPGQSRGTLASLPGSWLNGAEFRVSVAFADFRSRSSDLQAAYARAGHEHGGRAT